MNQRPRTAPNLTNETPYYLLPALAQLRHCRTGAEAIAEIDAIPDNLLPDVAAEIVLRQAMFAPIVIRTVLQCVSFFRLARRLGAQRASAIMARYLA